MSGHPPQIAGSGPPSATMSMPPQQQQGGAPPVQNLSQQNLNQIVRVFLALIRLLIELPFRRCEAVPVPVPIPGVQIQVLSVAWQLHQPGCSKRMRRVV